MQLNAEKSLILLLLSLYKYLKAAHTYVPSRGNKVPYKIKVLGPTEEDWKYKKELYSHSRCGVNWSDDEKGKGYIKWEHWK